MSLEATDKALKDKLSSVYPNVVFGPLQDALKNSIENRVPQKSVDSAEILTVETDNYSVEQTEKKEHLGISNPPVYKNNPDKTEESYVVKFPMIAFDRINNPFGTEFFGNDPSIRRGRFNGIVRERAFPVTPQYQIDIISDRRHEVDEIWRELVMYLYLYKEIEVNYSPDTPEETVQKYYIELLDTDNTTDIDTFGDNGRVYRQTLSLQVSNVQMIFNKEIKLIEQIPLRIVDMNGGNGDEL